MHDLYGEEINSPNRRRRTQRRTTRTQCRAPAWQNTSEPTLQHHALFAEATELIADLPGYLHEIARHVLNNLEKPVLLPPGTSADDAREVMSVVYRLRLDFRSRLYVPGDPEVPRDYVMSLTEICKLYQEEMLAEKGFRSAAHGISVERDSEGNIKGYRVQAWGDTKTASGGIRTGHIHAGYRKTLEEAYKLQAEWWLKHRKIDLSKLVCYNPDSAIAAIAELMRDAAINAGNDREVPVATIYDED